MKVHTFAFILFEICFVFLKSQKSINSIQGQSDQGQLGICLCQLSGSKGRKESNKITAGNETHDQDYQGIILYGKGFHEQLLVEG